jgi:hypothetical protein
LAERSQKTQSFHWPVSAVWPTFNTLIQIGSLGGKQIADAARNWQGGSGGSQPAVRIAPARRHVVAIDDFNFGRKRGSVGARLRGFPRAVKQPRVR